ncbi:MAG: hypothetical protein H6657_11190 [Ardenticatenaceae bacterium]|nr:hypothetical protein [Ardenticatenaceae bacterium]
MFVLALYPILKLVQWIIERLFSRNFEYKGLIWKSTIFGLKSRCPQCLREVECIREAPPQAFITRSPKEMQEYIDRAGKYNYSYKCRIHGNLPEVPNMHIKALTNEAQREMKWLKGQAAQTTKD